MLIITRVSAVSSWGVHNLCMGVLTENSADTLNTMNRKVKCSFFPHWCTCSFQSNNIVQLNNFILNPTASISDEDASLYYRVKMHYIGQSISSYTKIHLNSLAIRVRITERKHITGTLIHSIFQMQKDAKPCWELEGSNGSQRLIKINHWKWNYDVFKVCAIMWRLESNYGYETRLTC